MTDDARFFAWLDGELDPAEAAEVEALVARDPELQRLADDHRAMQASLRNAFDPLLQQPVPLAAGGTSQADVIDFERALAKRRAQRPPSLWKQAAALAATLALGIFAGNALSVGGSSGPVEVEAGRLVGPGRGDQCQEDQRAGHAGDSSDPPIPLSRR